jgi:ATP-binding cassette, subfamily C (CFTR/MRP), member 1
MFSGTVRENLDPYNEHSDGELWSVLREVGLEGQAQHAGGLEGQVDGSGSGQWSLGQMQLVCLARAALTKVPILCCDEATAAMDPHTEKIILEIIDRLFCKHTIITIAHRLDAVIKADQALVMEKGKKQEMAPPSTLLADPNSFFSKLVDRSGAAEAAALRRAAAEYEAAKRAGHVRGQ